MSDQQLKNDVGERLREELEALPGVRRVVVDGPPHRVFVIGEMSADETPLEVSAQAVLARSGWEAEQVELNISYLPNDQPARRVRWVAVEVERPRAGWMSAEVELEWAGKTYRGKAEGEGGLASELRVCGLASSRALESILDGALSLSVVGIKSIRVFDHDLVAVLLHSPQAPDRHLVGVSLVSADVHRSASLAVLNATNRLLGNYLATSD